MAVEIANTEITNTFEYWRNRTNELAYAMSKVVLTTDGSLSPSSLVANSIATGNATVTGTFFANNFSANQGISANSLVIGSSNFIANTSRLETSWGLISNSSTTQIPNTAFLAGNTTISGSWANVTNDLFVRGNLTVNGSLTYTGNSVGDILPQNNTYSLGNTSARWSLYSIDIKNSNTMVIGDGYNSIANSFFANTRIIWIGNNVVSTTINSTSFTGTSNNTLFVGSVAAVNVVSNAQLTANLANYATLSGAVFTGEITATVNTASQPKINHNSLLNYDANQHFDHTSISITAGNGLSGGGTIAANRTLSVLANTGIVSNSSGVFANSSYIQSLVNVSNNLYSTSGTSAQVVDSFLISSYMGAEYLLSVSDSIANNKYITKVLVMNDGSTSQITEYGSITTNNNVGTFSATQNSTHIILHFTPVLTATTVKFTRTVV